MNNLFADFSSSDLDVRHEAEYKLADLARADSTVIDVILQKMREGSTDTRWYLSRSLIKVGDTIIPRLIDEAKRETDSQMQKYYGAILASFGTKSAPYLIDLFSCENVQARGMAGAALERIGDPAISHLQDAAKSTDVTTKTCAILVLGKLGVFEY